MLPKCYNDIAFSFNAHKNPMQPIQQQVIEALQALSTAEQQEVLDFAESLKSKRQRLSSANTESVKSFLKTAQAYIGAGSGLGDLSTNPKYMEGYGASYQAFKAS